MRVQAGRSLLSDVNPGRDVHCSRPKHRARCNPRVALECVVIVVYITRTSVTATNTSIRNFPKPSP